MRKVSLSRLRVAVSMVVKTESWTLESWKVPHPCICKASFVVLTNLVALFTTPAEVEDFIAAGVDLLAPSIGNIHGDYGPSGPQLDFKRLGDVNNQLNGRAYMALHGTNDFSLEIMRRCIRAGVVKVNVNKLLLDGWNKFLPENANKPLMQLMSEGMDVFQKDIERWMDICGSSGTAS